jgi:hypothetical protein
MKRQSRNGVKKSTYVEIIDISLEGKNVILGRGVGYCLRTNE